MDCPGRDISTDADAMAVEQDRNSSSTGSKIASDDDNVELEGSEYSLCLHKLETSNASEWDEHDESDAISQQSSEGPPDLVSSTDEDDEQHLASGEFIRESIELFESVEDKKSRQRLLEFTQG
jgi:hypothetical protein